MGNEAQKPVSVLLIIGNPADAMLITECLKEVDFVTEVAVASDGQTGLDMLFRGASPCSPNLIVLDRFLARVPPRTVLSEIKASVRTRDIPLLLLGSEYDGNRNGMPGGQIYAGRLMDYDDYLNVAHKMKAMLAPQN